MITVFQGFSVLMFPAADIVDIKAVIAAPCVPAMGPVLLIAFRRPGASYYRSSAHRNKSYQVHPSPHKRIGYDSVGDIERGISTWKRADGDGEGLCSIGKAPLRTSSPLIELVRCAVLRSASQRGRCEAGT